METNSGREFCPFPTDAGFGLREDEPPPAKAAARQDVGRKGTVS